jgi:hypothetical protein
MPRVAVRLAVLRRKHLGLGPPRLAWLGFFLTAVGIVLLGIASMPMLAGVT